MQSGSLKGIARRISTEGTIRLDSQLPTYCQLALHVRGENLDERAHELRPRALPQAREEQKDPVGAALVGDIGPGLEAAHRIGQLRHAEEGELRGAVRPGAVRAHERSNDEPPEEQRVAFDARLA